jgi:hypothetical protein
MLVIRVVCIITHHIICLILFNDFFPITIAGCPCGQYFNDPLWSIILTKALLRSVKLISLLSNQLVQTIMILLILVISLNETLILYCFHCDVYHYSNTYARDHTSDCHSHNNHYQRGIRLGGWCLWDTCVGVFIEKC